MEEKNLTELFIEELIELINKIKTLLTKIEVNPDNKNLNEEFRLIFHTIKGNSGFMGLKNLYQFNFLLETIFTNNVTVNSPIIQIIQESVVIIEKYMQDLAGGELLDLEISYINNMKKQIRKI